MTITSSTTYTGAVGGSAVTFTYSANPSEKQLSTRGRLRAGQILK